MPDPNETEAQAPTSADGPEAVDQPATETQGGEVESTTEAFEPDATATTDPDKGTLAEAYTVADVLGLQNVPIEPPSRTGDYGQMKPRFDTVNPPISEMPQREVQRWQEEQYQKGFEHISFARPQAFIGVDPAGQDTTGFNVRTEDGRFIALPPYRCHKVVGAAKIDKVEIVHGACVLTVSTPGMEFSVARVQLPGAYAEKHKPEAGGYLVVYEDGYCSWSPSPAFEEGYTRLSAVAPHMTVSEIEAILQEPDANVRINPDGTVTKVG